MTTGTAINGDTTLRHYHATNRKLAPGAVLRPTSKRRKTNALNAWYSTEHTYFYAANGDSDTATHLDFGHHGTYVYEIAPVGAVLADPEPVSPQSFMAPTATVLRLVYAPNDSWASKPQ